MTIYQARLFFNPFEKNNGFKVSSSPESSFSSLVKWMNWKEKAEKKNRKQYDEAVDKDIQSLVDQQSLKEFEGYLKWINWEENAEKKHRIRFGFDEAVDKDIQTLVDQQSLEAFERYFKALGLGKDDIRYQVGRKKLDSQVVRSASVAIASLEELHKVIEKYNLNGNGDLPSTKTQCRKLIKRTLFVNIYDFIEPNNITRFSNVSQLRRYSVNKDKIFRKKVAKKCYSLKILLRHLFPTNPEVESP